MLGRSGILRTHEPGRKKQTMYREPSLSKEIPGKELRPGLKVGPVRLRQRRKILAQAIGPLPLS
jgi:hypothetical protein